MDQVYHRVKPSNQDLLDGSQSILANHSCLYGYSENGNQSYLYDYGTGKVINKTCLFADHLVGAEAVEMTVGGVGLIIIEKRIKREIIDKGEII